MAAEATVALSEHSTLAWREESTRGTLPSTASAWREFGDTQGLTWADLGPRVAISREPAVGSGQEPNAIIGEGLTYGNDIGPFRVRDPLILGHVFGKESARAASGSSGFFRHTLIPTDLGQLPSFAVAMIDQKLDSTSFKEAIAYLECVMPRLGLRGEEVNPDGSGGHLMAVTTVQPHNHTVGGDVEDVTVNLGTGAPFRFSHGKVLFEDEQIFRVKNFEFQTDRQAEYDYYWQDTDQDKPFESAPRGAAHTFRAGVREDGATYGSNNRTVRGLLRNKELFDVELQFIRTTNEDEFRIKLEDVILGDAPGERSKGPIMIRNQSEVRKASMTYCDQSDSAFFPT